MEESGFPLNGASLQHWRLACAIPLRRCEPTTLEISLCNSVTKRLACVVSKSASLQHWRLVCAIIRFEGASLQHWRLACAIFRYEGEIEIIHSLENAGDNVGLHAIKGTRVKSGDLLCHPDFSVAVANHLKLKVLLLDVTTPILSGSEFHVHYAKEAARVVKILSLLDSKSRDLYYQSRVQYWRYVKNGPG
ncbi:hypothetical protein POM88_040803 [Heracleum sosnowskyi]|uniref:Uncharacterized protein n=1 Tax=Heracleum sosnowskyi TaxID=360622 RepID=A0AAD8HCY7_9APIA|nr:hypothetical protein POM88_040803 [Heracleum sosnowskyi]